MKKENLSKGRLYQIINPSNPKKLIYAVFIRIKNNESMALVLPVYKFSRNQQTLKIELPRLLPKKLESEFLLIPLKSITRTVYFRGKPIHLSQTDLNFMSVEALYYSVGKLNQSINDYMDHMQGDELAEDTAEDFTYTAMHMLDLLEERFHPLEKQPSTQLEIFQYGIYRVHLIGDIGSEKTGSIDVLVWHKYVNAQHPEKSTFFCFPVAYRELVGKAENRVQVQINNQSAWVNIAQGRRISLLRFDHPIYDKIQKRPTFTLSKRDIHDVNIAFLAHYSEN